MHRHRDLGVEGGVPEDGAVGDGSAWGALEGVCVRMYIYICVHMCTALDAANDEHL